MILMVFLGLLCIQIQREETWITFGISRIVDLSIEPLFHSVLLDQIWMTNHTHCLVEWTQIKSLEELLVSIKCQPLLIDHIGLNHQNNGLSKVKKWNTEPKLLLPQEVSILTLLSSIQVVQILVFQMRCSKALRISGNMMSPESIALLMITSVKLWLLAPISPRNWSQFPLPLVAKLSKCPQSFISIKLRELDANSQFTLTSLREAQEILSLWEIPFWDIFIKFMTLKMRRYLLV